MTDALDFHPEKIPVADFPFPAGSGIRFDRSGLTAAVTDRAGFAFLACCTRHEAEGTASGFYAQRDKGRILGRHEAAESAPQDCGRDAPVRQFTEADVGTILDCGCEVTRANIPCGDAFDGTDDEGQGHDYPDTGCGECRFGVPAVWHDENCEG